MDKITRDTMSAYFEKSREAISNNTHTQDDMVNFTICVYLENLEILVTHLSSKISGANYVEELKLAKKLSPTEQLNFINASLMTEFHKDLL